MPPSKSTAFQNIHRRCTTAARAEKNQNTIGEKFGARGLTGKHARALHGRDKHAWTNVARATKHPHSWAVRPKASTASHAPKLMVLAGSKSMGRAIRVHTSDTTEGARGVGANLGRGCNVETCNERLGKGVGEDVIPPSWGVGIGGEAGGSTISGIAPIGGVGSCIHPNHAH